jgi:large subunit ribosomal protein L3
MKSHKATFIGIKQAMHQTWDSQGRRLPVSVILAQPLTIITLKSKPETASRYQVGLGTKKAKNKRPVPRYLFEANFPEALDPAVTPTLLASVVLAVGDIVTVSAVSKGQGFTGVMKRHGFKGGPKTHGQSDRARAPGSIGQGTSPGRIHKGKRMAGHSGAATITVKNLQVIKIDDSTSEIWLNGPVPGSRHTPIKIQKTGHRDFPGLYQETQPEVVPAAAINS